MIEMYKIIPQNAWRHPLCFAVTLLRTYLILSLYFICSPYWYSLTMFFLFLTFILGMFYIYPVPTFVSSLSFYCLSYVINNIFLSFFLSFKAPCDLVSLKTQVVVETRDTHTKRQTGDPARLSVQLAGRWGQRNWKSVRWGKNILYLGMTRAWPR
jgi:hypothetical protein